VNGQTDLKLSKVNKSFSVKKSKVSVLKNIDLNIKKGEFSCVIGPNGSGKTTLVKIIAGIEKPSSGVCQQSGEVSYLPQQDSLLPWLTVKENIELPGKINGSLSVGIKKKINGYLKKYKLTKFSGFYPGEISGGMKQKTALIRTIVYQPQIIVFDEPFAALDAITRIEMQQMLVDLWQEYKPTILCVTHDINEAIFLSDRVFVLSKRPGKILRTFEVGIDKPRTLDDINLPEALKLRKDLHRMLLT
jgi:ABC-type nitrate/sulfonate/bicarbonate transport system ATPase subunit